MVVAQEAAGVICTLLRMVVVVMMTIVTNAMFFAWFSAAGSHAKGCVAYHDKCCMWCTVRMRVPRGGGERGSFWLVGKHPLAERHKACMCG